MNDSELDTQTVSGVSNSFRSILRWNRFHTGVIGASISGGSSILSAQGNGFYGGTTQLTTSTSYADFSGNSWGGGNTADCIDVTSPGVFLTLVSNLVYGCGAFGIKSTAGFQELVQNSNNYYGGNAGGNRSAVPAGTGDGTLSADPWVSRSTGNFVLSATGISAIGGRGYPGVSPMGTGYSDVGALQSQAAAGGGQGSYAQ